MDWNVLLERFLPYIFGALVLLYTYLRTRVRSADVKVDAEKVTLQQQLFVMEVARNTLASTEQAQKSREAAEEAVTAAKAADEKATRLEAKIGDLEKSGTAKDAQIVALETQVKQLEARIEDLNKKYNERGEELKEKDAIILSKEVIIAAKDAEIKDLHAHILVYADAAPSNVTPPPAPPDTAASAPSPAPLVMDVNIVGQAAPVVITPADAAAIESRRQGVVVPKADSTEDKIA